MRKCTECKRYTLREDTCPYCGGKVRIPHPARFSPEDKYSKYKGMMRSLKDEEDNHNTERKN